MAKETIYLSDGKSYKAIPCDGKDCDRCINN